MAAFPFPAVSQTPAEEMTNFYLVGIFKKNTRSLGFFFTSKLVKHLALISVNFVSLVSQSLVLLCSFF